MAQGNRDTETFQIILGIAKDVAATKARTEMILEEARRTNGRVTSLEKQRWVFAGGLAAVVTFLEIFKDKLTGFLK